MFVLCFNSTDLGSKPHLLKFTDGHQHASTISTGAKFLTSKHAQEVRFWLELLLNQSLFLQERKGAWYEQLAMIHMKYEQDQHKVKRSDSYRLSLPLSGF